MKKLGEKLHSSECLKLSGSTALCCQCSAKTATEWERIHTYGEKPLKWVCGGHFCEQE
jgi:hypothetical protein